MPVRNLTIVLITAILISTPAIAQWQSVGTSNFTVPNVAECDMTIDDSTGEAFVVFNSYSYMAQISVMKFTGAAWVNVGAQNFSPQFSHDPSIAIHPVTHQPYVAFNGNGITVMKFDGTTWTVLGQTQIGGQNMETPVIRFNPATNEPYLALNNGNAVVYQYNGSSWQQFGGLLGSSVTNFFAREIDFSFHPLTNQPYVVYHDAAQNGRPVVKKYNGSGWVQVGGTIPDTAVAQPRLAIDSASGQVYIAYAMSPYSGGVRGLHCRTLTGNVWTEVGSPGFGYGTPADMALRISPITHRPYIAYLDAGPEVVKFDGYNWLSTGIIAGLPPGQDQIKMAFHPFTHKPYVLHNSGTSCTVARLDYCSVSTTTDDTVCNRYQRADNRGYYTASGVYADTLMSKGFCDSIATINLIVKTLDTSVTRVGNIWTANQSGAAYQWYYCHGVAISGATSQTYTLTGSASVTVMVTYDGCTGRSGCPPPTISVGSLASYEKLLLFPNPTNGELHFRAETPGEKSIEVFDAAGMHIASYKSAGLKFSIRLAGPSGIYFVRTISSDGFVAYHRIIKN